MDLSEKAKTEESLHFLIFLCYTGSLSSSPSNINIPGVKSSFRVIVLYEKVALTYFVVVHAKSNPSEYLTSWKYLPLYKLSLYLKDKF